MFLRSLVKLNNSVSFWNFAPKIQVKTKKRFSPHSASISVRNFGFLIAKWILLAEKLRGPDFITKISTNSGYRLKILAIFPEFLNEGQKKKRSSFQKFYEIRCESTKITKIRAVNTNSGVLGLDLHSSSLSLLISSRHSPRLGEHKQSFGRARPPNAPRSARPVRCVAPLPKVMVSDVQNLLTFGDDTYFRKTLEH